MGIDACAVKFLLDCRDNGVSFDRTLTLGRQDLMATRDELGNLGVSDDVHGRWADPLFSYLGASGVDSLDASGFEGASIVHDLNTPLPDHLKGQFSAVVDCGTLEHVFDIPTALGSAMAAVAPRGHLILVSPANNEAGHGFYQFSPELWFRTLGPDNGFEVDRMLLHEMDRPSSWWEVLDPDLVGSRGQFRSVGATYLFVLAKRVGVVPMPLSAPQQSDYFARWQGQVQATAARPQEVPVGSLVRRAWRSIHFRVRRQLRRLRKPDPLRLGPFWRPMYSEQPAHFRELDDWMEASEQSG